MTTQEREAIYEHCAKLCETRIKNTGLIASNYFPSGLVRTELCEMAELIREHAADPVKYP